MASTLRPGTTAGATTQIHSTTRGGAILATRGTTGTGTYATTLGIMTTAGDILRMVITITTILAICLHALRSIVPIAVQATSQEAVLTTDLW